MPLTRRTTLALIGASLIASPALAGKSKVFATNGIAIQGYDPVAYFDLQGPVEGKPAHASNWNGTKWVFASAQNKARFDADPTAFAPQFGGYCAYAVSKGATAPTDPTAWTVYQGKMYLNFSPAVRNIWRQDVAGNIAKAEGNWPAVLK